MRSWWTAFVGGKQVNGRALLIVMLAMIVGGGCTYLVHGFQVRRNAGGLLEQAGVTEGEGDTMQAIRYLQQYLGLMPGDTQAMSKLGFLLGRQSLSINQTAIRQSWQGRAYFLLDAVLRRPDEGHVAERRAIRREVSRLAILLGRFPEAYEHIQVLRNSQSGADDPELLQLKGQCEVGLGEYAKAEKSYEQAFKIDQRPTIAKEYALLLRELKKPALADGVIKKMADDDAASPTTRLEAARYFAAEGQPANAWPHLRFILDKSRTPSEEVLQLAGEVALGLDEDALARSYFEQGRQRFPKNQRLSRDLALLEIRNGDSSKARALLDPIWQDLPKEPMDLWIIADMSIDIGKVDEARLVIKNLRPVAGGGLVDYLEARLLLKEGNWGKAVALLDKARVELLDHARTDARFGERVAKRANLLLAQGAEHLLNADQKLKALRRAVDLDPFDANAIPTGRALALAQAAAGELEPALARLRYLVTLCKQPAQRRQINEDLTRLLVDRNRALPPNERDWREVIDRLLGDRPAVMAARILGLAGSLPEYNICLGAAALNLASIEPTTKNRPVNLLLAEVLFMQGKVPEARAEAEAERGRNPDQVGPWLFLVALAEAQEGAAQAGKVLDQAERRLPQHVEWPLLRVRLLLKSGPDEARKRLPALLTKVDQFKGADRVRLLAGFAEAFNAVGALPEATRLWRELAEHNSDDLQVRFTLFEAALQAKEWAEAEKWLKGIKTIEGVEGAFTAYAEAAIRIAKAQTEGKAGMDKALAEARPYLARAALLRPSWAQVPLLEAAAYELDGLKEKALDKYRAALERGERRLTVLRQVLQLMQEQRLFTEANALINSIDEKSRNTPELGRIVALTLQNAGAQDQALTMARTAAKDSKDARDHSWLANMAYVASKSLSGDAKTALLKEAEQSFVRACELARSEPSNWVSLVSFLVKIDQKKRAEKTLEQAQQSLPKEQAALVLAVGSDLLDQVDKAEEHFRVLLAARPNDPLVLQDAAEFFARRKKLAKAADTLRSLLAPAAQASPETVTWARQNRALMLALQAGPQQIAEAESLLEQAGPAEQQTRAFRLIKAQVLAVQAMRRPEAIQAIESLENQGTIPPELRFMLAQLYEADGKLPAAEAQLVMLLRDQQSNPIFLERYVSLLLRRRHTNEAKPWLAKLKQIPPERVRTKELEIELALADKDNAKASRLVEEYVGAKGARIDWAAAWFDALGQSAKAEVLYRTLASSSKQPESALLLALHLGNHKKVAEALAICERAWDTAPPEAVAATTVAVLRAGAAEPGQWEAAENKLLAALKKAPGSDALAYYLAAVFEYQHRPDDSIGLYRALLAREPRNIAALNNLAYLLALAQNKTTEALQLVNQAIEQEGATDELLDTRALIYLKSERPDLALQDLRKAVAHARKVMFLFHLAQARQQDGDKMGAAEAWSQALDLGLKAADLHPLEQPAFEQLRRALD